MQTTGIRLWQRALAMMMAFFMIVAIVPKTDYTVFAEGVTIDQEITVMDQAGYPVDGASVTIDGGTYATSANGKTPLVSVVTEQEYIITVSCTGYTASDSYSMTFTTETPSPIIINKVITAVPSMTSTEIAYGNDAVIDVVTNVEGQFVLKNGGTTVDETTVNSSCTGSVVLVKPDAGDYSYTWSFVPSDTGYGTVDSTSPITFQVTAGEYTVTVAQDGTATYGDAEKAKVKVTSSVAGSVVLNSGTAVPVSANTPAVIDLTETDAQEITVNWTFTPDDTNYSPKSDTATVVIGKKPVSIQSITFMDKDYDASTVVGVDKITAVTLSVSGVTVTGWGSTTFATNDKAVGNDKAVTVTYGNNITLSDNNYTIDTSAQPTTAAIKVTPIPVSIKADTVSYADRTYDGGVTVDTSEAGLTIQLDGVIDDDTVSVDRSQLKINMINKLAGDTKAVSADATSVLALTGADAANYTLAASEMDKLTAKTVKNAKKEVSIVKDGDKAKVEKVSDGNSDLTDANKATIDAFVTGGAYALASGAVVNGDDVALELNYQNAIYKFNSSLIQDNAIAGLRAKLVGADADNYVLDLTDYGDGTVLLKDDLICGAEVKAIAPAAADATIDLTKAATVTVQDVEFGTAVKSSIAPVAPATEYAYWMANGVKAKVVANPASGVVYKNQTAAYDPLAETRVIWTGIDLENNAEVIIADSNGVEYGPYTVTYQNDSTAPTVSISAAKNVALNNNATINDVDFGVAGADKGIQYTVTISETESGIKQNANGEFVAYYAKTATATTVPTDDDWTEVILTADATTVGQYTFDVVLTEATGAYLSVKVEDVVGNEGTLDGKRAIVIEADAPKLNIAIDEAATATDDAVNNSVAEQSHKLYFIANDEISSNPYSGIQKVTYTLTDANGDEVITAEVDGNSFTGASDIANAAVLERNTDGNSIEFSAVENVPLNGTYTLTVKALDNCGNESAVRTATLVFDNEPVEISVSMGGTDANKDSTGEYYYKVDNGEITVTFTDNSAIVTDGSDGSEYKVTVDGIDYTTFSDNGKIVIPASAFDKKSDNTPVPDGQKVITVYAKDHAGNETTTIAAGTGVKLSSDTDAASATFVLDKTVPVATVAMTAYDNVDNGTGIYYYNADKAAATVTFTDDNLSKGGTNSTYTAKIDSNNAVNAANGEVNFAYADFGADGSKTISVYAKDIAGNETTVLSTADGMKLTEGKASFVLDTVAPTVKVEMSNGSNYDGKYWYKADNCGITVTFADTNLAATADNTAYTVTVDGIAERSLVNATATTVSFTAAEVAASGDNTEKKITVVAKDAAGNAATAILDTSTGVNLNALVAKFALDTVAPVLKSVTAANCNFVPAVDKTKAYWNSDFSVIFEVVEANYYADYVTLSENADTANESGVTVTPDLTGASAIKLGIALNGGAQVKNNIYQPSLKVADPAGNVMKLDDDFVHGTEEAPIANDANCDTTGKAQVKIKYVLDNVAPVVTMDVSGGYLNYNGETAEYYNEDIKVAFTVDEINYTNNSDYTQATRNGTKYSESESRKFPNSVAATTDNEGHYTYVFECQDLALNKAKFQAGSNVSAVDADALADANGSFTSTEKVMDVTSPVMTAKHTFPNDNPAVAVKYDNRFYYNKAFTNEIVIVDTNIGTDNIQVNYGTSKPDNFQSGTVDTINTQLTASVSGDTASYIQPHSAEGLYQYRVSGYDKAGNPIVIASDDETADKLNLSTAVITDANAKNTRNLTVTGYIAVIDTTAPAVKLNVTHTGESNSFYAADLKDTAYQVSTNLPYQKITNAVYAYSVDDYSPVELTYGIHSTLEGDFSITTNYIYKVAANKGYSGEQILKMTALKAVDRAGNVSDGAASIGTAIYLDSTAPKDDQQAPTASIAVIPSGGVGPDGKPLFDGTVDVKVHIQDVNAGTSASGLYGIHYEVSMLGGLATPSTADVAVTSAAKGALGKSAGVFYPYGTAGDQSNRVDGTNAKPDETLTFEDVITFTFDAAAFNYNGITIKVWAEDNANNGKDAATANVVEYTFGIDTTSPTITVRYDNNAARNEKYFKADRTATVVVTERNFRPDLTKITTESAASISGWTYASGSMANHDDDTWTATVSYTVDGDYTFAVETADAVHHACSDGEVDYGDSVAPKEFVLDKTNPVIEVTFDNNNAANLKYYKDARVATILITEHNFGAEDAVVTTTASIAEGNVVAPGITGWGSNGDINTTTVPFTNDGDYTMKVDFMDLAGNEAETVTVDEFTVDQTPPELEIGGVEDRMAYNGDVAPYITYHDINLAADTAAVNITGYNHREGSNLNGTRTGDAFGGSFVCDNIEPVKANDDIYTATGYITDLAGNTTEAEIMFSVNRFGSTYMLSKETEALVDGYYTNVSQNVVVTEINVSEMTNQEVTVALNGDVKTLTSNDYVITGSNPGWMQYVYTISGSNFEQEGAYTVTLFSEDEATNTNTNRAIKEDGGKTSSLDIEFLVDKTAPSLIITGVEEGGRYRDVQRSIMVRYDDNAMMESMSIYVGEMPVATYNREELQNMKGELEYVAKAANDWQEIRVVAHDAAGNETFISSGKFLLTDNLWVQYIHNTPLVVGSVAVVLVIAGFILFLIKRKKDEE